MLSLLAVAIDCAISGGLICIFDVFGSKVIRAIQVKEKVCIFYQIIFLYIDTYINFL